jgi:hypothetical protein
MTYAYNITHVYTVISALSVDLHVYLMRTILLVLTGCRALIFSAATRWNDLRPRAVVLKRCPSSCVVQLDLGHPHHLQIEVVLNAARL